MYVVEGEIAAGKTELVVALAEALRAKGLRVGLVLEPVDRWKNIGILQKFYENPARHAYGFQTFVYATRILDIVACVEANPDADLYLFERSPATDAVFMELQRADADPVEMDMYKVWCGTYARLLPVDLARAKVLYLKPGLDRCMRRLAMREREGEIRAERLESSTGSPGSWHLAEENEGDCASAEGGVSLGYQHRLRRAHEAFFQGLHAGEFPLMEPSPFPRDHVYEIPQHLADGDYRRGSPHRAQIVADILALIGY